MRTRICMVEKTRHQLTDSDLRGAATIRIGRAHDCQWRIADSKRQVSSHHAELYRKRGRIWIRDLGSKNGTFLHGKRIRRRKLQPGDQVDFGDAMLLVERDAERSRPRRPWFGVLAWILVGMAVGAAAVHWTGPLKPHALRIATAVKQRVVAGRSPSRPPGHAVAESAADSPPSFSAPTDQTGSAPPASVESPEGPAPPAEAPDAAATERLRNALARLRHSPPDVAVARSAVEEALARSPDQALRDMLSDLSLLEQQMENTVEAVEALLALDFAALRQTGGAAAAPRSRHPDISAAFTLVNARRAEMDSVGSHIQSFFPHDPWGAVVRMARATGIA